VDITLPARISVLNVMSTAGASILALGYLLPMVYLTWSMRYGKIAGPNPWPATGLEWKTASPPLTEISMNTCRGLGAYDFVHRPIWDFSGAKAPGKLAPAHGDD